MRKFLLVFSLILLASLGVFSQNYSQVTIRQIQTVSQDSLQACNGRASFIGDTVRVVVVVVTDGNLSEVASGSVQGGHRPFIFVNDTANGGLVDEFTGMELMGVYSSGAQLFPVDVVEDAIAGDILRLTCRVTEFEGSTQLEVIGNSTQFAQLIGTMNPPTPKLITVGQLNDANRVNILPTGEAWEGAYVEFQNVTVTSVNLFSNNTRVSIDVTDVNGNVINVSDRFLAQRLTSWATVNPGSPQSNGSFISPSVGTFYSSLKGVVRQSQNGCTGGTGRGYELNPFLSTHYMVGSAPPTISQITRNPEVPNDAQTVTITANIADIDGTVQSAQLLWSNIINGPVSGFQTINMTPVSGNPGQYTAAIPAQTNGTVVRYLIRATDNQNNVALNPFTNTTTSNPNVFFYTVRNGGMTIQDIQYVLNPSVDASPYIGKVVTVTGVVTASAQPNDLGYIYMQQPNVNQWAGISVAGSASLATLKPGQEVVVTGTVVEFFGLTRINVTQATPTGNTIQILPVDINPSDSAWYANRESEKYEGMYVRLKNPTPNGKIFVSRPRNGNFGDFWVATSNTANINNSTFVQTARSDANNYSSLYVSLVSDDTLATANNVLVPIVETSSSTEMEAIQGIWFWGFGRYKLHPRNNFDVIGLNSPLERPAVVATAGQQTANNAFKANWEYVAGGEQYTVEVSTANDFNTLDGSSTSGANSADYTVSGSPAGTYYYRVKAENSAGEEGPYSNIITVVLVTSIDELIDLDVNAYPNPAVQSLFIENKSNENINYSIVSFSGKLLKQGIVAQGRQAIDVNAYAKGVYMLQLNSGNTSKTLKLIIQ